MGKRVLFLAQHFITLYSFRRELIERLCREGYEVYLSLPPSEENRFFEKLGCRIIPTKIDRRGVNPVNDLKLLAFYCRIIPKVEPDVVFSYTVKPNIYGGIACTLRNAPYIVNITGLGTAVERGGPIQKIILLLYHVGLRKANKIFFQNVSNLQFMKSKCALKAPCAILPGSGVNLERYSFAQYPKEDVGFTFLVIGRLMWDKGTDEMLEAAKIIRNRHPNVTIRLMGFYDGDCKSKVERFVQAGFVEYLGQQEDIRPFLRKSHATIHPSYHEGMANVLLESAATGRPVLASNIPGCRETFDEGVSGIGFEPRNVDDLVRAIEQFIALPYEKKAAMGRAGREKMEREFDRKIVVDAYMKEIHKIEEMKHAAL